MKLSFLFSSPSVVKSSSLASLLLLVSSHAQTSSVSNKTEPTAKENTEELAKENEAEKEENFLKYDEASIRTRKDARTMTLSIPAPRGQIVDRFGYPYSQTKVIWYPALQMEQFEDESDEFILKWCKERIANINEVLGSEIKVADKLLIDHYRHRRWIPMPFKKAISRKEKDSFLKENKLLTGAILHPIYQRTYPQKASAAHIIGYVGSKSAHLERGPINYGDPLFWELEGRGGLEKRFDNILRGEDGQRKLQYDSHGREVRRQDIEPKPGGTVVTTIDMAWQKRAESVLRRYSKRGAFVVIDIETGEVLVMASRPSYDLNLWVPYMKPDDYKKLLEDKSKPLYARAFQGLYPPASAFKIITGIAAIDAQAISQNTKYECPKYIKLGNHKFWDWSKRHRGNLDFRTATSLSNNPYFIQAALAAEKRRPGHFMNIASMLGYGSRTGLPLDSEAKGNILTAEYTLRKYGRTIKQGDIANASIGQGSILASPLQVAQSMAAVANGGVLPVLHLIKQVQNNKGVIVRASKRENKKQKKISAAAIRAVKLGMFDVVNAEHGTGKKGAINYALICGKTGTAQWGPESKNQGLAWFAGYFPHKNPKYAFAVLYEGSPHEKVSGGKKAAPMVPAFFNPLEDQAYTRHQESNRAMIVDPGTVDNLYSPLGDPDAKPAKAMIVEDDEIDTNDGISADPPKALIVEDDPEAPAVPVAPKAVPVEEEPEDDVPPLRDLPAGVEPVVPADPPKAIPVP